MYKAYAGIGSRAAPRPICREMVEIAEFLYRCGYTLRSGGAAGADSAFEQGAGDRKEIYLPWKKFNQNPSPLYEISREAYTIAEKYHPGWKRLTSTGRKFHARNCYQVLGLDLKTPVKFVVCWTTNGRICGGTGQAMRIAMDYDLPIFNLFSNDASKFLREYVKND